MERYQTQQVGTAEASGQAISLLGRRGRDFLMLVKLRLNLTVVFSSVMAYLIAGPAAFSWLALGILALGGFLVTGAANALNQVLEKDYDRQMRRTADRPLAAGRMTTSRAVLLSGLMSMVGISLLALFNPWAAFFGMLALISYAFVYTPLKRVTPFSVMVGAVPGALPSLIGAVAAEGQITLLGLTLFAIQFVWQFPHFWSIGWLGFEDYQKAGYRLMPSIGRKIDPQVGTQAFLYALFLFPLVVVPYLLGVSGALSAIGGLLLTVGYAFSAWRFSRHMDRAAALQLMFYSFVYLPLLLVFFFADKF